ncbi:hypothetical protein BUALT_Bualt10G0010500 [Buddleja alternifolia]|uniref:Reverse transcriptase domain-containing protein n=1 Tax=Buddleja alternifolia TaxID=168488 RepID=A0AAV6WWI5_9LAMI|nr:hypothetical protein BUALT_Bualt10G0010500 [Buddleja alternifolia]
MSFVLRKIIGDKTRPVSGLLKEDLKRSAINYFQSILSKEEIYLFESECHQSDGFSAYFCQYCWDVIQDDIIAAVVDFFHCTPILRSFTMTSLILIPKLGNPSSWSDFSPISLYNVSDKILYKLLSIRLATLLPHLIDPSQSGFVHGKLIRVKDMIHSLDSRVFQLILHGPTLERRVNALSTS